MFTRNWYKAFSAIFAGENGGTFLNAWNSEVDIVASYDHLRLGVNSSAHTIPSLYHLRAGDLSQYGGVYLGTGTTPPTFEDIAMSGDLITTYNYSTVVTKTFNANGGVKFACEYTVTNTGSSAFTVGEIGLFANLRDTSNSGGFKALLERTVLDTPITIEAGGVGKIHYTVEYSISNV